MIFNELKPYEDVVFKYEQEFLTKFVRDGHYELLYVWFNSGNVKINFMEWSGQHITTTIKLVEFMEWYNLIQEL